MEAIILAGGLGTRLNTIEQPKPLAPINGKPFIEIQTEYLLNKGFTKIIYALGHRHEEVLAHLYKRYGYVQHTIEAEPLGTGGAIKLALTHVEGDFAFVFNGDVFFECDFTKIVPWVESNYVPIVIGVEVEDSQRYGRLQLNGNRITNFLEKGIGGPGIINAGGYVFPKNHFVHFPDKFSIEKDFFSAYAKIVTIHCYQLPDDFWIDIGIPEDYQKAQYLLKDYC